MSNAVTVIPNQSLSTATWTREQIELVKRTIFKDATDDELKLFAHVATRTGLDPFARQIYAVKRKDNSTGEYRMTIQTGIDGFRLIASRTNAYAGRDEADFVYDKDGKNPLKCKVTIYKLVQGVRCAFTATALWSEYYPGEKFGFMWKKLPETMLEKCCEAKALRMAFPAELSGVYSTEEMEQAKKDEGRVAPEQPAPGDGNTEPIGYRIPFGQWKSRSIEDVYNNMGPEVMASYIRYLEDSAAKKGEAIKPIVAEFISHAADYLGAMENEAIENLKS